MKNSSVQRVTVPFGPSEWDLYKYISDRCSKEDIKTATCIKKIIKENMDQQQPLDKKIEQILDKYFEGKNISVNNSTDKSAKGSYTKEDKSALLSFMKK